MYFIGYGQEILFPGLNGVELLDAVQDGYTPDIILSYAETRDTLYANIDVENDSVRCIYSAFAVYLPTDEDPTSALFAGGINTEHIYPQGKGATDGTPAHRNMHHLAASRVDVNQDRANLPFAEIPDNITDNWYYRSIKLNHIPGDNIDLYTEGTGNQFEPKESVKGNIARAVFYIHAIYRDQVMAVDPLFFMEQQADLCAWHFADPVDEAEMMRTEQIANYQDGKENPFVLDCTLAERMYCEGVGTCMVSNEEIIAAVSKSVIADYYGSKLHLKNKSDKRIKLSCAIYSMNGNMLWQADEIQMSRQASIAFDLFLIPGIYHLRWNENGHDYPSKKLIVN